MRKELIMMMHVVHFQKNKISMNENMLIMTILLVVTLYRTQYFLKI